MLELYGTGYNETDFELYYDKENMTYFVYENGTFTEVEFTKSKMFSDYTIEFEDREEYFVRANYNETFYNYLCDTIREMLYDFPIDNEKALVKLGKEELIRKVADNLVEEECEIVNYDIIRETLREFTNEKGSSR